MRIAFAYHRIAPECLGGAERYYQTLCRVLADQDEITYLTCRHWDGPPTLRRDGIEVRAVAPGARGGAPGRGFVDKLRYALGLFLHLARHGDRYQVVETCCFPHVGVVAAWLALRLHPGTRLVVDWHEVLTRETWLARLGRAGMLGWLAQGLALRTGDLAITFSRLHAARLSVEGCAAPIRIVPEFHPERERAQHRPTASRERVVVFAGRLVPEKRPELIAAVVAHLRRHHGDWRGIIFGAGPSEDPVRRSVSEWGVEDAVMIAGFVPWREVANAFERASALVLPTMREGFGLAVLEATAHGLPCVLVSGPDNAAVELIEEGRNGSVVTDPDPRALAEAVLSLTADGEIHASTRAWYEEVSQRYDPLTTASELRAAHGRLLGT